MPLSELTEIVARIDGNGLKSPDVRSSIAQSIGQLRTMLDRVGASEPAAQLGVAALLLQRTGDGATPADEDAKQLLRTLLIAVEKSFHLEPVAPPAATPAKEAKEAPARAPSERKAKETRQATRSAAELAVVKDMLLGEVLIHFGVLAPEDIRKALELQSGTRQDLGHILVEKGFTSRDEIQRALNYQNQIRGMIAAGPKAKAVTPPKSAAEQPCPIIPALNRSPERLRLATELLLGEMLVLQGTITREGLGRALELQRSSGMLIGEALIQSGGATRSAIEQALVSQGRSDRIGRRRPA